MLHQSQTSKYKEEGGNILIMILVAIALIAALTMVIQSSSRPEGSNIDKEAIIIRASEVQRYAGELERGVRYILQQGASESDIRFAHPNAPSAYGTIPASTNSDIDHYIFDRRGGGATYRNPPKGIQSAAGGSWEFYGGTHAPAAGSDRADLIAVLPNVTLQFCEKINDLNDQPLTPPIDSGSGSASPSNPGDCVFQGNAGRFGSGVTFYSTANTMDETSFDQDSVISAARPAMQACVQCSSDSSYHFYHVLLVR